MFILQSANLTFILYRQFSKFCESFILEANLSILRQNLKIFINNNTSLDFLFGTEEGLLYIIIADVHQFICHLLIPLDPWCLPNFISSLFRFSESIENDEEINITFEHKSLIQEELKEIFM